MSILELRLPRVPGGPTLDPDAVVRELRAQFPEAQVLPEDRLAAQAEKAERALAQAPGEHNGQIVGTLRRNARLSGPQYSFELPSEGGRLIKGYVQRYVIVFLLDEPLPDVMRHRLVTFLRSFGTGVVKHTSSTGQVETLPELG
jgi:hypothetical protein